MRTFLDIKTEVLRYFDTQDEEPDSSDVLLVEDAINNNNAKRSSEDKWKFMYSGVHSLTVVAGQSEYILPHSNFDKLQYLWSATNRKFHREAPMREIPGLDVNFQQDQISGETYYEVSSSRSLVSAQPSEADTLTLTSTSLETAQLYVEGEDADGVSISETLTVDTPSTLEFAKIVYYAKTATFTGTLTLSTTTDSEVLIVLTTDETGKEFPILQFHSVPTQADTCTYRYFLTPRRMVRDFDRPNLPYPVSNILVYDSLLDLATYNELDSETVSIWRKKQEEWETVLYMKKLEGDTVSGQGETIGSGQ